jgi:two-component system cell cycle sensor histidine kinase/response regulator CckA
VILGLGRSLLKELDIDDLVREDIGEICASAEQAAALTRQLLAFSRRQPTSTECVELNQVVRGLEGMLAHLLGEDLELAMDLAPQLDAVCCDPAQLEQVLVNLVANARDAMPAGGEVLIRTLSERVHSSQAPRLGLERAGRYNVLQVTDTGEGIDEVAREQIFDPFFTTRELGQGTGLGLAIVYGAAKECGGGVGVESELGVGTTFSVYLRPHGALELPDEADREDPPPQSARTILLVEDEEAIRRLVRRILSGAGHRVIEAGDGRQALEIAETFEGSIHLLVTDVVMPGIGGGDLARRLCESHPDLEVLFLSGYLEDMTDADAGSRQAGRFLQKPFTDRELLEKIQTILGSADS